MTWRHRRNPQEYIWIGDQMVGIVDNSSGTPTLDAVTTGQIEEPLLVTAADQSLLFDGYVDPYGNQGTLATTSYTMNMRLPGQYFQAGSGLSQNGWRDYDPTIGRYIEGDPIGIDGGQNVYAYVDGDPLNESDPMGLAGAIHAPPAPFTIPWWEELPEVIGGLSEAVVLSPLLLLSGDTLQGPYTHNMSKGGRQSYENEYTREARLQPDPCAWLQQQYSSASSPVERAKIQLAQKVLGCRNKQKRCK